MPLTIAEQKYIRNNYTKLHPRQMAHALNIKSGDGTEKVRKFMREHGLLSINKSRVVLDPSKPLSEEDRQYIKENILSKSVKEIAIDIKNTYHVVYRFLKAHKIRFRKGKTDWSEFSNEIREATRDYIQRPPAQYSNKSYHHNITQ